MHFASVGMSSGLNTSRSYSVLLVLWPAHNFIIKITNA